MDFVDKVKANIERNGMLDPEQHVIVALSGGADSVALLAGLTPLGSVFYTHSTLPAILRVCVFVRAGAVELTSWRLWLWECCQ